MGHVTSQGAVVEDNRYKYEFSNKKMNSKNKTKNEIENLNEEIIGDVCLGLMVDEMLSSARDMTVDSLLEGFNYGLEKEAVG